MRAGLEEGRKRKDLRFSDVRKTWDGNLRRKRRSDLEPQQSLPLSKLERWPEDRRRMKSTHAH